MTSDIDAQRRADRHAVDDARRAAQRAARERLAAERAKQ